MNDLNDLKLENIAFNSLQLPVHADQQYVYVEGCETSGRLIMSLTSSANVLSAHEAEMATESCAEHSEMTDIANFDNEIAIAAVEEISDGEQKQQIESVIAMVSSDDIKFSEDERYYYKVRKGRRKRNWSHDWQNLCRGSGSMYEQSVDMYMNNSTANILHRKPRKRLFAHR